MKTPQEMGQWSESCKTYQLLEIIGKKRVVFIIYLLQQDYNSFNKINNAISMMSGKILSDRLKTLQKTGLVVKTVESTTPLKIRYSLTDLGKKVAQHISAMSDLVGS